MESRKPIVSLLFQLISKDVWSLPSSNLRIIYEQTRVFVQPGVTLKSLSENKKLIRFHQLKNGKLANGVSVLMKKWVHLFYRQRYEQNDRI